MRLIAKNGVLKQAAITAGFIVVASFLMLISEAQAVTTQTEPGSVVGVPVRESTTKIVPFPMPLSADGKFLFFDDKGGSYCRRNQVQDPKDAASYAAYSKSFSALNEKEQANINDRIKGPRPSDPKGLVPCGRNCDDPTTSINEAADCDFCSFFYLFNNIVNWVIKIILPAIALLFVVFGGFTIATSRGNPAQSQKGKDILIWTFAGYAVIFVGWMVLNSFLSGIGVVEWTGLTGGWWQFSCGI